MQVVRRAGRWRPGRVIVLAVVLAGSSALAAPGDDAPVDATARPDRPRIGLVLGGGGAKGAAHVGVLGILDELRIPVDCVIGTSMGALIGGTFATGVDAHELEAAIRGISWQEAIAFKGQREKIPMRRKLSGVTYSNSLEFGVRAGRMTAPSGFISTQNIEQTIQRLVSRSRGVSDFDRLPIPFRAIATDMQRGEMVVLSSGSLAQAMRASMSVPGLFAPVTIGDQVLGDGGLTRNVAVDVARQTCADVVIAVAVPNPVPTPEDLQSPLTQVSRTIDVLIGANEKQQLDTLGPDDVAIVVEMSEIGPASFDRVSETIPFGRAAALAQRASLERYSLPEPQYRAWRDSVFRAEGRGLRLAAVTVTGLERVDEQYVRGVLDLAPGDEVTEAQVGGRVNDVFALSDFESVRYALRGHGESPALELRVKEKSWGPDIVRFDLGLYMGTDSNTAFTLAADYLRSWINELGGELHGAVRVGRTSGLDASLYQPLDRGHRWFVEPGLTAQTSIEDIFQDGDAVARYQFSHAWGYLDAGRVFGRHTEVRAGVRSGRQQAERDIAFRELEEIPAEGYGGLALSVTHDSRDREILGRKGMLARVDYFRSEDSLGAVGFYERLEGTASYSLPVGENVVYLRASGGSALDTLLPAYDTFTLGGPVSFPGLSIGELRGMSYWSAQATYLHQVAEISSLFGQSVYAGFALTAGDMGERIDFSTGETIYSGSLILSGRTPLGPVGLIVSYASTDEWQVVFGLGRPVEERSITDPAW